MQVLSDLAAKIFKSARYNKRWIVAIAGPPAAGKSTLTQALAEKLSAHCPVAVLAQDGYHYDNAILRDRGLQQVKGAPQTFDVESLRNTIHLLRNQTNEISVPVFDRQLDLVRGCTQIVSVEHKILLIEGNYLLLAQQPWAQLDSYFDQRVLLEVPIDLLRERLVQRWLDHDHTPDQARERVQRNDLPNASLVLEQSVRPDIVLTSF